MDRPLAGLRAATAGGGSALALLGRLLADQGAEVTRLVPPGGDAPPRWPWAGRAVEVSGPAEAAAALSGADLVATAAPEALAPLGLSPADLDALPPGAVRLNLPAFSADDPEAPGGPCEPAVADAAAGLHTDVSLVRAFLGLGPVWSALPHSAAHAAVHAALAAVLALRHRALGGAPERIEVPQAAAGLSAMASAVLRVPAQPARYDLPPAPRALSRLVAALRPLLARAPVSVQARAASLARRLAPPLLDAHPCADGRRLYVFAVDHDRMARRLLARLGLLEPLLAEGLADADAYAAAPEGRNLREGSRLSPLWRARLRRRMAAALAARPAADWERDFAAEGLPCALVRSTAEALALPEFAQAGIVEGAPGARRPGPLVWTRSLLATGPARPRPRPSGPGPLSGLRALDLSSMVAGPVAARTLGDYGAEVIRIVAPRPRHGPRMSCWCGIDVDRGKRSAALDLTTAPGREALRRLLHSADVIVHNFTDPAAVRPGRDARDPATAEGFARALARRTVADWRRRLADAPVTLWPLRSLEERREGALADLRPGDPVPPGRPALRILRAPHPAGGVVDTLVPTHAHPAAHPLRVPAHAPKPGADTRALLAELGFAPAEIDAMIASGAAAEGLAPAYLPP